MKNILAKQASQMTIGDALVYVWLILLTIYGPVLAAYWIWASWNKIVEKVRILKRKVLKNC